MRISRAFIRKDGDRQLTCTGSPRGGRMLNNMFELKAYAFWDSLTKRKTDGTLVRLMMPVSPGERAQEAKVRLQEITRRVVLVLDIFLPGAD